MKNQIEALLAMPFPANKILWRPGATNRDKTKAIALAYVDARLVMARLDDVLGADGWQSRITRQDGSTFCELGICIDGEWIWKTDSAGDSNVEAEKGAASDALKRAGVQWGIGRYLYALPTVWHELKDGKYLEQPYPTLPDWATEPLAWAEIVKRRESQWCATAGAFLEAMGYFSEQNDKAA